MVMDLPKEVPKSAASSPQHADPLALGAVTSFQRGLSFSGDFLEIFNTAIEYRLVGHDQPARWSFTAANDFEAKHPAASP
jgi:hypothetical protein